MASFMNISISTKILSTGVGVVFIAGMLWADLNSKGARAEERNDKQDKEIAELETRLVRLSTGQAVIMSKVTNIEKSAEQGRQDTSRALRRIEQAVTRSE